MATRCDGGDLKHRSKVGPFRKNWVRVNWINDRIGFLQITCIIMLNYIVDKDINLELGMFACLIYMVLLSYTNSLGSFGLTLVWCRCVSQMLGAPLISKCRNQGELRGLPFGGRSCRPLVRP